MAHYRPSGLFGAIVVLALLGGCDETKSNGPAGSAGSTGDAASIRDGAAGSSGGGTADGAASVPLAAMLPSCLADLLATCPLDGSCRGYELEPGRSCYASGVNTDSVVDSPSCSDSKAFGLLTTVTKPDGSPCYTVQSCATDSKTLTWRNAAGDVVAQGTITAARVYSFSCAAGGDKTGPFDCSASSCSFPTHIEKGQGCEGTPCP